MEKGSFNGRIFDGREDGNYRENCIDYLGKLSAENSPFNCENLRVLPEAVKLIHTYKPPTKYKKGTLICLSNVKHRGLDRRCYINSILQLDNERNLVFGCSKVGGKNFEVKWK